MRPPARREYQAIVTDANGVISTSNAATLTINPNSPATVLLTSASSVSFGQPTTLTATVTPGSSGPDTATGSVVFSDQGTPLTTVPLSQGTAVFTTSALSVGVHTLTVAYLGDANHTGSTSAPVVVTVGTPPPGVISGTVFHDYNSNGVQDPGEPGIAGQTVFLDLNGSGAWQAGDLTALTDANGNYQFTGLSTGTYTIRQLLLGGVLLSTPASGSYQVTLTSGASVSGQNFADVLTCIAVPLILPPSIQFPAQGNANADYVEALYRAILDRDADPVGLASWIAQLNTGALSRLQVVQAIRNSPEHFTQEVSDFYLTLLNRQPDSSGLQNWVQQLEAGMREEQMAFYFLDSPEYLSQGDKHFVDAMYQSLLGRSFDTAGEANWLSQLGDDTTFGNPTHPASLTHEQVITDFL